MASLGMFVINYFYRTGNVH